jgi:hypothetical protein
MANPIGEAIKSGHGKGVLYAGLIGLALIGRYTYSRGCPILL